MTDFARAFQNDQNNISDAVNENGPLVSRYPVPSCSHMTFLMHMVEFIR